MPVDFTDNSIKVKAALNEAAIAFLYEAAGEIEAQTKRNQTRVDTGDTKGKWTYVVDEGRLEATVGNPLENAIYEEMGTGEYALNGDGRKGGWKYQDAKGEWHYTTGKTPLRPLYKSFTKLKPKLIKRAEDIMKGGMK